MDGVSPFFFQILNSNKIQIKVKQITDFPQINFKLFLIPQKHHDIFLAANKLSDFLGARFSDYLI